MALVTAPRHTDLKSATVECLCTRVIATFLLRCVGLVWHLVNFWDRAWLPALQCRWNHKMKNSTRKEITSLFYQSKTMRVGVLVIEPLNRKAEISFSFVCWVGLNIHLVCTACISSRSCNEFVHLIIAEGVGWLCECPSQIQHDYPSVVSLFCLAQGLHGK